MGGNGAWLCLDLLRTLLRPRPSPAAVASEASEKAERLESARPSP